MLLLLLLLLSTAVGPGLGFGSFTLSSEGNFGQSRKAQGEHCVGAEGDPHGRH